MVGGESLTSMAVVGGGGGGDDDDTYKVGVSLYPLSKTGM